MLSTLSDVMNLLAWFDETIRQTLDVRSKVYKSIFLLIGDVYKNIQELTAMSLILLIIHLFITKKDQSKTKLPVQAQKSLELNL